VTRPAARRAAALALVFAACTARARAQEPQAVEPAAQARPAPQQEPVQAKEPGYGKRLWVDLKALAARPAHLDGRDWRNLGIAALAVGGTMAFDEEIRDFVQGYRSDEGDDAAETLRPLGHRTGPALLLGGLWVAGALADEPSLVAIGKDGVEASLFSVVLITPVMKKLVGRARPDEDLGPTHFEPFSEYQSFPSGEATQAFTIAAVVAAHTENPWVEGVSWGLAGLIGLERLYLDRHWASDVVAGALIGAGVGSWVARRQMRAEATPGGVAWVVLPAVGRGSYGVFGSVLF
jgi:membrane-associated phospholipid phosphatase